MGRSNVPIYVYYGSQQSGGIFTGCLPSTPSQGLVGGTANVELSSNPGARGS